MFGFSDRSISNLLFWITRKKWLILSFLLSISFFYFPTPDGLSSEGHRTLIIVIVALSLIVSETIPLPAVAMLILIMEVVLGVDTPDGVASSFMSDAVLFIMYAFFAFKAPKTYLILVGQHNSYYSCRYQPLSCWDLSQWLQ